MSALVTQYSRGIIHNNTFINNIISNDNNIDSVYMYMSLVHFTCT